MIDVAVVGGGMAGLAAAWRLKSRGVDVRLYEAGARVGGFVGSLQTPEGFLLESGPGSIRGDRSVVLSLIRDVGLGHAIEPAQAAAKLRFIWAKGQIHALPSSPLALLKSPLLSPRGKLTLLSEPFRKARKASGGAALADETLAQMLRRRIGSEAVAMLVDPFVTGIYAGDPERLGVDAFLGLAELEREHGSLFKGMRARGGLGGGGIFSLAGGLGTLPEALGAALGEQVELAATVGRIEPIDAGVRLEVAGRGPIEARAVILATPAHVAGPLLVSCGVQAGSGLSQVPHAPISKVELGLRNDDLANPIDGFGLLCASSSPLPAGAPPILGIVFASSLFAGRAPAGCRSLSVMLGGVRDPGIADRSDAQLVAEACAAVRALLGLRAQPLMSHVSRWPRAIPQYPPGHARAIGALRAALPATMHLAGNYLDGISLDAVVASGFAAADAVRVYR